MIKLKSVYPVISIHKYLIGENYDPWVDLTSELNMDLVRDLEDKFKWSICNEIEKQINSSYLN